MHIQLSFGLLVVLYNLFKFIIIEIGHTQVFSMLSSKDEGSDHL
jgi:hypothetical protein